MTPFDEVEDAKREGEVRAWLRIVKEAIAELVKLVHRYRGGGKYKEIVSWYGGAFNICIQINFDDDGPDAILRLPKGGVTTFRDEKVRNEVEVMKFLRQNTTTPVPRVIGWGQTADSPKGVGPFIIMDYVEGVNLSDILQTPNDDKEAPLVLNHDLNNEMLDIIYRQIAGFMLQIYQFDFSAIGAIAQDPDGSKTWSVARRPLTYNINELVTCSAYLADKVPQEHLSSNEKYLEALANVHLAHLQTQRNLADDADDADDAERRYVARHLFAQLAATRYSADPNNTGPFKLFCDDLRPTNMLVDKDTLQITAVIDFEFTNAMPAHFAHEPPWWLLLRGPAHLLDEGLPIQDFVDLYQPRLEQFLRALEHEEASTDGSHTQTPPLSSLMRDSWKQGDFWFNVAAWNSLDVDAVFYAYLDDAHFRGNAGPHLLSEGLRKKMESFVEVKMDQKVLHDLEYDAL